MSSDALSGRAAATTTSPRSVSRTVSQLTVRGSSGYGLIAWRTGVANAAGSVLDSSGTRTTFTMRRDKGSASTASLDFSFDAMTLNSPPSKAAT